MRISDWSSDVCSSVLAQRLGFAEADPSFDIDGVDAAHKLSILASLAFGTRLDFEGVAIDGIREVEAADIAYAETLGFKVRLVGIAQADANGLFQRVHACLAPVAHPLAHVDGSLNAVVELGSASCREHEGQSCRNRWSPYT